MGLTPVYSATFLGKHLTLAGGTVCLYVQMEALVNTVCRVRIITTWTLADALAHAWHAPLERSVRATQTTSASGANQGIG